MSNLYTHQDSNTRKTWLLMSIFLVIIISLGWFISWYYQNPGILFFAVIFSVVLNITSFWYSDKIVLKISGAKLASKEQYYDLYTIVENLSITAGLPLPKIYIIEDPVPNAFATGRDKNHAVVAFTTGLLSILEKNELEGVVAHELSHIGNKDILLQTVVVILVGFITLLSDWFLRMSLYGGGDSREGGGRLQIVMIVLGVALLILSPIIAMLIQLAISRKREFLADSTGALLTRYPEGLATALEKISVHGGKMKKTNHATAHLYIADPFGKKKGKNLNFLHKAFLTHPPVEERVKALRGQ